MSEGLDPTTIIFALLAIVVVWKLRSILGTHVDVERRPREPEARPPETAGKVVRLPGAAEETPAPAPALAPAAQGRKPDPAAKTEKAREAVAAVAAADPKFAVDRFVAGAKAAYEMIVVAFANGDRQTLGTLLSPEVLANFAKAIDGREAAGETAVTRVVSIGDVEIVDGTVGGGVAQISTRISARMTSVVRDREGAIVTGDPDVVVSTDDLWTFAREVRSADPTWRLVATESHQQS